LRSTPASISATVLSRWARALCTLMGKLTSDSTVKVTATCQYLCKWVRADQRFCGTSGLVATAAAVPAGRMRQGRHHSPLVLRVSTALAVHLRAVVTALVTLRQVHLDS